MAATTTKLGIINRGLQELGIQQIASLSDGSAGARAMNRAYDSILLAALRENIWTFSIKRLQISADPTAPIFGKARYYQLPGDYIRTAPEEPTSTSPRVRDWNIEGQYIVSDDDPPIDFRYVSSNLTESMYDVLFAEVLALMLADATCEELTNSNTKKDGIQRKLEDRLRRGKKTNSIESTTRKVPIVSWISTRL